MNLKWLNKKLFNYNKFKGFTLIELIVVMAIGAMLMGLGISSIVGLRRQTIVKSGVNEFIDTINLASNEARNSFIQTNDLTGLDEDIDEVFNRSESQSYRVVYIDNGDFNFANCERTLNDFGFTIYDCGDTIRDAKSSVSEGSYVRYASETDRINYQLDGGVLPSPDYFCSSVIFAPGSGETILAGRDLSVGNVFFPNLGDGNICFYEFYHVDSPDRKTVLRVNYDTLEFDII